MKPQLATPAQSNSTPTRLFTFASGGWVLLLAGLLTLGLVAWAIGPALSRNFNRPPGDGKTIESYGFDLSNLAVRRELIVPAMLHRGMVPVMTNPTASGPDPNIVSVTDPARWKPMQRRNDLQYGKYLVPSDLVIGVIVNGEARAYPLSVMYVHEIVNDALAGVPIAVTYHWPCASAMVFDRRVEGSSGTPVFAVSGLVYNSNMLMYAREETHSAAGNAAESQVGGESLWCQLLGKPISGDPAARGQVLAQFACEVVTWSDWSLRHPQTSVLDRDLSMTKRYADAAPKPYMQSERILFPVDPLPPASAVAPKAQVLAVQTAAGARRVYPVDAVLAQAQPASGGGAGGKTAGDDPDVVWRDTLGETSLRFIGRRKARTLRVEVESGPPAGSLIAVPGYWFAWHAMFPDDPPAVLPNPRD